MTQHDPTCIEVLIDANMEGQPIPPPHACQLVPPCKEGNHIAQAGHRGTDSSPRRIGKYLFSEDALKHDLAALRRGKVYTRKEFYPRARAWYKAEIDRILHWHKVYKENNPEPPKLEMPKPKPEQANNTNKQGDVEEGKMTNKISQEGHKKQEVKSKEHIKEESKAGEQPQEIQPKSQQKKAKVPAAPTRIQPSRAAKRKAEEPLPSKVTRKKKRKVIETVQEKATNSIPTEGKEQQPPTDEEEEEESGETKGDYELSLDEWRNFETRYNSATNPVTPMPSPASISSFSQNHLQGIDVANFAMRLERAVETKIWDLIHERQGITIDKTAGGLCLRGYYHHPFRCALDGNYVPPPRFDPAGAYSPGEDWRPPVKGGGEGQKGGLANTGTKPVSPTTYRPPGSGNQIQGRISTKAFLPSSASKQQQTKNGAKVDMSPSIPPPQPNLPLETPSWPIREANSTHQRILKPEINTSARNSPAPEAVMEISPTLGRWRPPTTGFPLEDFAEAIVDVSGLRFAVDLCAEYIVDGKGARFFML